MNSNEIAKTSGQREIRMGYDPAWIDAILAIHAKTEMARAPELREMVSAAFAASFAVATCWQGPCLIGCGRLISDGQMYSAVFDVVVDPEFQKMGIGRRIVQALIAKVPHTCIHLTSTFGNEPFYEALGFRKHKSAFALYPERMKNSAYLEKPTR